MSMFEDMTKTELYAILTGIFTASLIVSNIIAGKTFDFFSFTLPCGVVIFPVIYIVNDVLAEIYGYEKARKVILLGFFMNLVDVICFNISIIMPVPSFFQNADAYSKVFGSTLRVLIASFLSYLSGSLLNAKVMVYLKEKFEDKLFIRCILSTLIGGGLDAIIFIIVGFYGTMPLKSIVLMIIGQVFIKAIYEAIVYPITKRIIVFIRALPEG